MRIRCKFPFGQVEEKEFRHEPRVGDVIITDVGNWRVKRREHREEKSAPVIAPGGRLFDLVVILAEV